LSLNSAVLHWAYLGQFKSICALPVYFEEETELDAF